MKFWDTCVKALREERGAYLVLIAAILPLIFGFVGLAVDVGNYQAHSAKLQHASDAAALAGATMYAANNESESSHPLADEAAEKYLKANLGSGEFASLVNTGNEIRYQVQTDDQNISYYRVYIKENLDTTFIRLLGSPFFTYPQGEAIATIPITNKETEQVSFGNLISFDGEMWGSFNKDNRNQIHATFDGDIYCYNRWGPWEHDGHWGHWEGDWDRHYRFYTGQARNMTPGEADQLGYYKEMQGGNPDAYDKFTYEADKALEKLFDSETTVVKIYDQNCKLPGDAPTSNYYYVYSNGGRNMNLELKNFSGNQNEPVYVYLDETIHHINVNLQEDIKRPIIFCYTGGWRWHHGGRGQLNFHSNNYDYRGVIYAPYTSTALSFESGTFNGSIITHDLELKSNHGEFIFEQFGIPIYGSGGGSGSGSGSGSGGSSGSGSSGTSVELKLVPDPGLGWDA